MPSSILDPALPGKSTGGPPRPPDAGDRGGSGGGDGGGDEPSSRPKPDAASVAVTGMWVALAPMLMLFLAFASAYIVRRGVGTDWSPVPLPRLLWVTSLVLVTSSLVLERARRLERRGIDARLWTAATLLLGIAFVAGQLLAWRSLARHGIGVASTPHASFFYLLTGAHAVHVAGGIVALVAAVVWPREGWRGAPRALVLRVVAIYWHFLLGLWCGLFALLALGR